MKHSFIYLIACVLLLAAAGCRNKAHYDIDRAAYPVRGIDVSAHNGDIDFAKVAADSIQFVFIKASEGTEYCDAMFGRNFENAQAAGLKASAYHYFRFDEPGHLQAYNFLRALTERHPDMPIAIDVEDWKNAEGVPQADIIEELGNMIGVLRHAGFRLVIYTNKKGYDSYIKGNFSDLPLWLCSFGEIDSDIKWYLWQFSHQGKVDGISGDVDLDVYYGSQKSFDLWIQ